MNAIILASIGLRVAGIGYSLVLLRRSGDRRFGFLTVLLVLMAARQVLTALGSTGTGLEELPGLVVSGLAVLTVHYLSRYVEEEAAVKRELRSLNDELAVFEKAVEHAGHAIFFTDPDGTITYANPAIETVTGYAPETVVGRNPRLWQSGEQDDAFYDRMWETITDGEVWDGEIVNQDASGELRWVDVTIAPVTEDGDVERFVAVETDVTDRKERQLRIEEQNERLSRLNRVNELLRDVNRRLVTATTREDVEEAVTDRFADDPWVVTAGVVDRTASGRLRVRYATADGDALETLVDDGEDALATISAGIDHGRTGTTQCVTVVDDVAAVGVVPLSYRETTYGALVLGARDATLFEVLRHDVRVELGETVGSAINAAERRRELVDERVTELTFSVDDDADPLFDLAAETACDVELTRTTTAGADDRVCFVSVSSDDSEAVVAATEAVDGLSEPTVVSATDDECLLRVSMTDPLADTLATHGATVAALTVDADEARGRLVVDVPGGDVRPVVQALDGQFETCTLVSRQDRERPVETADSFRDELTTALTDRQLEALRTAHLAGYFEWPREHSGQDVADMMDISQSTYMQHLRAAERKLTAALFASDDDGRSLATA
ncbi:bacterio-opsin activator domain-containing protein [Salinigranum halophilum]|uniref:bacterio-opsin activator domain-containing protein n=1 Tax=Salinigranum halophilum TaxID=2565931 RepID=UPI0010A8B143|nr:bacterio-opsin activator domain-containing protein [Salinigranum halophilum]